MDFCKICNSDLIDSINNGNGNAAQSEGKDRF